MDLSASKNIIDLRKLMADHRLDAYIVPSADPHQTEYVHPHWRSRAWLSGFTGSAGTAIVLADKAGLWTDGRYFIQAERELQGSGIDLFKMRMERVPEPIEWICENIADGGCVGVDGRLITAKQGIEWSGKLTKKGLRLVTDDDLISALWRDRPALSVEPAHLWPVKFAGRTVGDKLREIRSAMVERGADVYLLASLADINWLFNIRGNDTARTPLLTAYALVERERATFFVDLSKLTDAISQSFAADGITARPYDEIFTVLSALPDSSVVYLCEERVSLLLRQSVACGIESGPELTELPKARKNEIELKNWERVHELDGVAMVRFWRWLEASVPDGGVDEVSAADELERVRRDHPECVDLSFDSISAYGANAAMMHYFPRRGSCATLEPRGLYLVDSGGQYRGGTTDITRTFALGALSDEQRLDYTLVLKGLIALSRARFLKGATGFNLDVLARRPLWEHGLDYRCGTGHGVGCYLSVHEGPQNFSQSKNSDTPFEPGMVVTVEPGVYRENCHGIRIENMVAVAEDCATECGVFYRFRTQTLSPIDTTPLLSKMLSAVEINWLDDYHRTVYARLAAHLSEDERRWLENKTSPFCL